MFYPLHLELKNIKNLFVQLIDLLKSPLFISSVDKLTSSQLSSRSAATPTFLEILDRSSRVAVSRAMSKYTTL